MRLAFYQPDIPQNLGAAIRLGACFGAPVDIIEPCGFPLTDRTLKRAALDYQGLARVERHSGLDAFLSAPARKEGALVLIETDGETSIYEHRFASSDTLVFGRESAGASPALRSAAATILRIPMASGARSLNVVTAAAVAVAEALRQTGGFPGPKETI